MGERIAPTGAWRKDSSMAGTMERTDAAENRAEWLDIVDRTDAAADRLEMLAVLLAESGEGENDRVKSGMASIIIEGADSIRELNALVSSYHPSPYRPNNQTEAEAE